MYLSKIDTEMDSMIDRENRSKALEAAYALEATFDRIQHSPSQHDWSEDHKKAKEILERLQRSFVSYGD